MIYTNGKILIDAEGDIEALEEAVGKLHEYLSHTYPDVNFTFEEEPFAHYIVPDFVQYEDMKNVLGLDIKRRAINEDTLDLPDKQIKEVKYYFTPEELDRKADDLVNEMANREKIELEKKMYLHTKNEELKQLEIKIEDLAQLRRQKYEIRRIDCTRQLSFSDNKVYYIANEEIVIAEEMTPADRQLLINFDGSAVAPSPFTEVSIGVLQDVAEEADALAKMRVNLDEQEGVEPAPELVGETPVKRGRHKKTTHVHS